LTSRLDLIRRAAILLLVATTVLYVPWLVTHLETDRLWLSVPFLAANLLLVASALVSAVNQFTRTVPPAASVAQGDEPPVAIIVPTAGEDVRQVERTARSVLRQDWPHDVLWLVVSDDAHNPAVERMVAGLAAEFAAAHVLYHEPPRRGDPARRGDAKAGNLNSALALVDKRIPGIAFVETRDADDEVIDPSFLRQMVGQLRAHPRAAFAQSIKENRTTAGDPFDNDQPHFYRGAMLGRHADDALFPCGSALVWRREALRDIDGFPYWNLVEDLQAGIETQRRGWSAVYVPIVGAVAQHSPEDLANLYQQRGTWAIDTMRLFFWGKKRGLSLRQRLHFYELALFYLQSFAVTAFLICPVFAMAFGAYPLETDFGDYALHFWPFAAALELMLVALHLPRSYEHLWRARVIWVGLTPVFARACVVALLGGRDRKPVYRVTRKFDEFTWYWRLVVPHVLVLAALAAAAVYGLATRGFLGDFDLGSMYWALLFGLLLASFVRLSWFGVPVRLPRPALPRVGSKRRVPS